MKKKCLILGVTLSLLTIISLSIVHSNNKTNDLLAMNLEALSGTETIITIDEIYVHGQTGKNWREYAILCSGTSQVTSVSGISLSGLSLTYNLLTQTIGGSASTSPNTISTLNVDQAIWVSICCGYGTGNCWSKAPTNPCGI